MHLHDHPVTNDEKAQLPNTENLTPSEMKKLRNKQRKAQKKAQLQKEKEKAEAEKKEAQKPRQQDAELDGPKEEELLPEKLCKVCVYL